MSTVNLLPADFLRRRCQCRPNVIYVVLFGVVMASIGEAAVVSERASRNIREVYQRINAASADAARLIDEAHQLESQKRMMLDKARMCAALMERLPRSYVLAMLSGALPDGASFTSVTMTVRVAKDSEAEAKEKTKAAAVAKTRRLMPAEPPRLALVVNLKGKAATDVQVGLFMASLRPIGHPLTESVDLVYSRPASDNGQTGREFQLMVQLKPNADALDAIKVASEKGTRQARTPQAAPPAAAGSGA